MSRFGWLAVGLMFLLCACPGGKYGEFKDAPADQMTQAKSLWSGYLKTLEDKKTDKHSELVACYFSGPLIASMEQKDFAKQIKSAKRKASAGLLGAVKLKALKQSPQGLILVVDSKAGEAGIPLAKDGEQLRFADLKSATGDWSAPAKHAPITMPDQPSLLYLKMVIHDDKSPRAKRLAAAVGLAHSKYRKEIISAQKMVADPVVRLGLGLARTKIDGFDESFLRNFPTTADGITVLHKTDPKIFEEMLVKLTNMGSMVEDPPANEILYKATAGAPDNLRQRFASALYDMGESSPPRFVNAVFNIGQKQTKDSSLDLYFGEVGKRKGAPKVEEFLKQFAREGEPAERKICKSLLSRFREAR